MPAIAINANISDAALRKITDGAENPNARLSAVASKQLTEIAAGGILVRAAVVDYLQKHADKPIASEEDLKELCERTLKIKDGKCVIGFEVDPTIQRPLADFAKAQGKSFEQFVKDSMGVVLANGWLYDLNRYNVSPVFFSDTQRAEVAAIMGVQNFDADSLIEFLKAELLGK